LSAGEVKNNNQLVMGASKAGGGWQESIKDHKNMAVVDKMNNKSMWRMMRGATKRARVARAMVNSLSAMDGCDHPLKN
jgi:hypothetical protein